MVKKKNTNLWSIFLYVVYLLHTETFLQKKRGILNLIIPRLRLIHIKDTIKFDRMVNIL